MSQQTISGSLFIQAPGVLKKELVGQPRSKRRMRRSRHAEFPRLEIFSPKSGDHAELRQAKKSWNIAELEPVGKIHFIFVTSETLGRALKSAARY